MLVRQREYLTRTVRNSLSELTCCVSRCQRRFWPITHSRNAARDDVGFNTSCSCESNLPISTMISLYSQKNVEVNTYGTLLTIQAFAPLLQASSNPQLACISASSCSITKPAGVPINPYSTSKAALNFITATLAFEERWLKVQSIHPGVVSVSLARLSEQ